MENKIKEIKNLMGTYENIAKEFKACAEARTKRISEKYTPSGVMSAAREIEQMLKDEEIYKAKAQALEEALAILEA